MSEGEKIDVGALAPELARPLRGMLEGRTGEVWHLTTDALAGAGYLRGDYVVIDTKRFPQPKDLVLAMNRGTPVFRLFFPPHLYALPLGAPVDTIMVNGIDTTVAGVIVGRISLA